MEADKGRQEQVRSLQEKTADTYSTAYLKERIDHACELIQIMKRAGYNRNEISSIFGLGNERYGKKERALLNAMLEGRVSPSDSLSTIKQKMDKEMVRSKQSWGIAFNRLIANGDIG